jgi:hypothetical protein
MNGCMARLLLSALGCGLVGVGAAAEDGFGGVPPLGPKDALRQLLAPYDLVKLNVLGANYCENLLDLRLNVTSYTHLAADSSTGDAWHLQFPDDSARFLECVAWEDQFSPVVRLELARRLTKGLLAARIPGAHAGSFFRHRSAGKTFLIFGDKQGSEGRLLLSMWGDEISGALKVGFRVQRGSEWTGMEAFTFTDPPDSPLAAGQARSARNWNASPVEVGRTYRAEGAEVTFAGRYWLSDEDKPLEFAFTNAAPGPIQIVIGEPGCPLPVLGDYRLPTSLHLPDRTTAFRSDTDGDRVFAKPAFRYLILRKAGAWAAPGYSTGLLVLWDGQPERVTVLADKGYGEVQVTYAGPTGKVWLYPYHWLDDVDLEAVHRSAEQFLAMGRLLQNGFPSSQMLNAIPAGVAAGAYLLTRYNDPMAPTARVAAARLVDRLFTAEDEGKSLVRSFFTVKAAAWMLKTANELGDRDLQERYGRWLERAMQRMCSPAAGYDGSAWPDGWTHFNGAKACWLAADASGKAEYLAAFERAADVYTIDALGIYRYGKKMEAPGGFETYSGSLPLGVWGCAGKLERVAQLITLDVPNGWHEPTKPVRATWNDAGAGPWAQDDANPEYLGISLRGARLPTGTKTILPVGAFPLYDAAGKVEVTGLPSLRNPFFLPGNGRPCVVREKDIRKAPKVKATVVTPGSRSERRHLAQVAGRITPAGRLCTGAEAPLVYRFDTAGAIGIGLDLRLRGDGYRVEVSADGKRWFERLDTWDREPADQSLDLSFLAGSREELLALQTVAPAAAARNLPRGGAAITTLELPDVTECWLELLVGNGYCIELSADGETWLPGVAATDVDGGSGQAEPDAAWIRLVEVTPALRRGSRLQVRISDVGTAGAYGGRTAFLQRLVAYGTLRSGQTWVRLSNVSTLPERSLTLEKLVLRTWDRERQGSAP